MAEKVLKITELRNWAKENGHNDSWWFSVDGKKSSKPVKAGQIPRKGDVYVMNTGVAGTEQDEWILFRYPGYRSPEERRRLTELSELQKVALEFFGYAPDAHDRDSARPILDKCFNSEYDNDAYNEFKWENRQRLYSQKQILQTQFSRFQNRLFYIREIVPIAAERKAIEEAISQGTDEDGLLAFLRANYPKFFLAENTRKRKLREWEAQHGHSFFGWRQRRVPGGCPSLDAAGSRPGANGIRPTLTQKPSLSERRRGENPVPSMWPTSTEPGGALLGRPRISPQAQRIAPTRRTPRRRSSRSRRPNRYAQRDS